jgi:ABC-type nitrate/sulfonate/bicarbonate transport system substrate-binding protein
VKGAWVAQTANQMIWPLSLDAGYFSQNGVNFNLSYLNGSTTGIAGLLSRDLDMITAAGSAVVGAQAAGSDVIMVAGFINQAIFRIMALPGINAIDDLRGKSIAVTKIGNADYFGWQIVADNFGYSMSDFNFVNAGDLPGQVALLQQGQVQAVAVSPPNDVLCMDVGGHLVLDTATLNYPEQNVGVVVTREYANANAATLTRVLKANIQAMARWKTDQPFTQNVINKYLPNSNPQFTEVGYSAYAPLWPQVPLPSVPGMQDVIQEVATQNPAAASLSVDQTIDTTIVQQIQASGFIQQVYGA